MINDFSLSANEQLALLVQERDTARANENALAERVSDLMDEIVRLNQEIARAKQQKLGNTWSIEIENNNKLR